jgi:hypothetical protein
VQLDIQVIRFTCSVSSRSFSVIVGTVRTSPGLPHAFTKSGSDEAICDRAWSEVWQRPCMRAFF